MKPVVELYSINILPAAGDKPVSVVVVTSTLPAIPVSATCALNPYETGSAIILISLIATLLEPVIVPLSKSAVPKNPCSSIVPLVN